MQLTTDVKENIIIFKDGSQKWITDPVYQQLISLGEGEKFTVDGNLYDYNMISKILSREEFYSEYPDKQPPVNREYLPFEPIKKLDSNRAIRGIIKGLKQYIASPQYQGTDAPKNILKQYEQRLFELESKNIN